MYKTLINNGIKYLPINWLAGFQPSTVSRTNTWKAFHDGGNTPTWTFLRVFEVSPLQRPCWWNFSDLRFYGLWNGHHRPTTIDETGHGGALDLWIAPKFHRKRPWKMMITGNTFLSYWVSGTFFWRRFLLNFGRVSNFDQLIQALTFLSPSWRSPTTFERVTIPKRSQRLARDV